MSGVRITDRGKGVGILARYDREEELVGECRAFFLERIEALERNGHVRDVREAGGRIEFVCFSKYFDREIEHVITFRRIRAK